MYQSWVTFGGDSKFQVRAIVLVEQVCNSELISLTCNAIREREREREINLWLSCQYRGRVKVPWSPYLQRERESGNWILGLKRVFVHRVLGLYSYFWFRLSGFNKKQETKKMFLQRKKHFRKRNDIVRRCPKTKKKNLLSLRVELKTSRLLNGCSNQLSYESFCLWWSIIINMYVANC